MATTTEAMPACTSACVQDAQRTLIDDLGVPLGPGGRPMRHTIAEAVFAGLATDTGWFRFSGADDRVYQLAARLLTLGVDKDGQDANVAAVVVSTGVDAAADVQIDLAQVVEFVQVLVTLQDGSRQR